VPPNAETKLRIGSEASQLQIWYASLFGRNPGSQAGSATGVNVTMPSPSHRMSLRPDSSSMDHQSRYSKEAVGDGLRISEWLGVPIRVS
jgi:hypothetical protein